jgi:hypothetical protein
MTPSLNPPTVGREIEAEQNAQKAVAPYFGLAVLCVFAASRENVLFSNLVFTPSRRVRNEKPQSKALAKRPEVGRLSHNGRDDTTGKC